jgi:NAD(P)-dependent dehydrogenase (short-subunit alcohol dehydrogenase family)
LIAPAPASTVILASDRRISTMDVDGRVWLITDASSGFGLAIARAALAAGDTVIAGARRLGPLSALVAAGGLRVRAVTLDVTNARHGTEVVDGAVRDFGRIDVLVNNAGRGQVGAVEETTDEELREIMEVHLFGPAALVRAVLPHMRSRGTGAIVQMSSFDGPLSVAGFGAYSASKCALEELSEALAEEVAPYGIKVLIVEPGAFRTSFSAAAILAALEADPTPRRLSLGDDAAPPSDQ